MEVCRALVGCSWQRMETSHRYGGVSSGDLQK